MASRQGLKQKRKEAVPRHKPRPNRDAIHRLHWLEFLYNYIRQGDGDYTRFNGQPLTESHKRALYRWREENSSPSIWTADAFLTHYGMILEDYFVWCEDLGKKAWAYGAPDWWDLC